MTNEDKVQSVYRFAACTYGACFGAALAGCCRNRTERDCDPCGGGKHRRSRTFGKAHAYPLLTLRRRPIAAASIILSSAMFRLRATSAPTL